MTSKSYIFHTQDVCPPEIHFSLTGEGIVHDVRFVGGGCPGNAELVGRLIDGRPIRKIVDDLSGIECRNATSCPDQLAMAFAAVERGDLLPVRTFKIARDEVPRNKIGFIGNLDGNQAVLTALLEAVGQEAPDAVLCVGNLTGPTAKNDGVISVIAKQQIPAIIGKLDWDYARGKETATCTPLTRSKRDVLIRLPQVLTFQIGDRKGMAFHGRFIQELPGYSDFAPFALEMNMVCGLSQFMEDETVFPALEAMTPQFVARVVAFSQTGRWNCHTVGGVMFLGVGSAYDDGFISWGILEDTATGPKFRICKAPFNLE